MYRKKNLATVSITHLKVVFTFATSCSVGSLATPKIYKTTKEAIERASPVSKGGYDPHPINFQVS